MVRPPTNRMLSQRLRAEDGLSSARDTVQFLWVAGSRSMSFGRSSDNGYELTEPCNKFGPVDILTASASQM